MSRGIGKLQQKILRCLEPDRVLTIMQIAAQTHGQSITRSEYECLRRAIHGLATRKLVGNLWWGDGTMWALTATADTCFEKFCEVMDRINAKRCRSAEPTLNPPDKSCTRGESNAYPIEAAP